jgi:hypothetical protein
VFWKWFININPIILTNNFTVQWIGFLCRRKLFNCTEKFLCYITSMKSV